MIAAIRTPAVLVERPWYYCFVIQKHPTLLNWSTLGSLLRIVLISIVELASEPITLLARLPFENRSSLFLTNDLPPTSLGNLP